MYYYYYYSELTSLNSLKLDYVCHFNILSFRVCGNEMLILNCSNND